MEFVRRLRPKEVSPLVLGGGGFVKEREGFAQARSDMSIFNPLLSEKLPSPIETRRVREENVTTSNKSRNATREPVRRTVSKFRPVEQIVYESGSSNELHAGKTPIIDATIALRTAFAQEKVEDVVSRAKKVLLELQSLIQNQIDIKRVR